MRKFAQRLGFKLVIAMLLMTMFTAVLPSMVQASPVTNCMGQLSPNSQEVDVQPGKSGLVIFTGTITCSAIPPSPNPIIVQLTASAGGWPAAVSPPTLIFTGAGGDAPITLSVIVPIGTPFTANTKVTVTGTYSQGILLNPINLEGLIKIKQYFRINALSELPVQEIAPGSTAVFNLKIDNLGNHQDEFEIIVTNLEELVAENWVISPIGKVTIESQQFKNLQITVTTSRAWTPWKDQVSQINLKVTSVFSGSTVRYEYPLVIRERGFYIPGFDPVFLIVVLAVIAAVVKQRNGRDD